MIGVRLLLKCQPFVSNDCILFSVMQQIVFIVIQLFRLFFYLWKVFISSTLSLYNVVIFLQFIGQHLVLGMVRIL